MDKVLTTTLLTMAAVVAAIMVINTMLPAIGSSSSSILGGASSASERIGTDIEIISVSASPSTTAVYVWIKNVGVENVLAIASGDLFFGKVTESFDRIAHTSEGGSGDSWNSEFTDASDTIWKPTSTIKLTISLGSPPSGDYTVRYITSNGVFDDYDFSP